MLDRQTLNVVKFSSMDNVAYNIVTERKKKIGLINL